MSGQTTLHKSVYVPQETTFCQDHYQKNILQETVTRSMVATKSISCDGNLIFLNEPQVQQNLYPKSNNLGDAKDVLNDHDNKKSLPEPHQIDKWRVGYLSVQPRKYPQQRQNPKTTRLTDGVRSKYWVPPCW